MGGRLVTDVQVDAQTGDVTAVMSRDWDGNTTVHPADALVFAIGITGIGCSVLIRHNTHAGGHRSECHARTGTARVSKK